MVVRRMIRSNPRPGAEQMTVDQWLATRKEAGLQIDPETVAEMRGTHQRNQAATPADPLPVKGRCRE